MEIPGAQADWGPILGAIAQRFDQEVNTFVGKPGWTISPELTSLPFWELSQIAEFRAQLGVPFPKLYTPKAREHCLDLGCGMSFLLYPWVHWGAYFYGHDLSPQTAQFLRSRAPQLNSKLFKGMQAAPAHQLDMYEPQMFDLAIATGWSYYFPLSYLREVWQALKRVMKPTGKMIIDAVDPASPWAEDWGLLELDRGSEPVLTPLPDWEASLEATGWRIQRKANGHLFRSYLLTMS